MIAKQKGYAVRVVIPGEVAPSIGDLLELYGARNYLVRTQGRHEGRH